MRNYLFSTILLILFSGASSWSQPMTRLEYRNASGTLREVIEGTTPLPTSNQPPTSFQTQSILVSSAPQIITAPGGCQKVTLQVVSLGKQIWYRVGSSTVSIEGDGAELLTWAAEIDCGPGTVIGFLASEPALLTVRFNGR